MKHLHPLDRSHLPYSTQCPQIILYHRWLKFQVGKHENVKRCRYGEEMWSQAHLYTLEVSEHLKEASCQRDIRVYHGVRTILLPSMPCDHEICPWATWIVWLLGVRIERIPPKCLCLNETYACIGSLNALRCARLAGLEITHTFLRALGCDYWSIYVTSHLSKTSSRGSIPSERSSRFERGEFAGTLPVWLWKTCQVPCP